MLSWKVIYVNSRAEKKVAERLQSKGIEAYCPMKKELKQWSDRKKMVESPLINGYVFVRPEPQQRDKVLEIQGVLQYVRYNGGDAVIRDIEITTLKAIETKGYYVSGEFGKGLIAGDRAEIKAGPFKGMIGIISGDQHKQIYTLLIESIDYSLTLHVPGEVLEKHKNE